MHVLGVILCGGQSSRMGSDKGLLPYAEGITWAEHQYALLESVCSRVLVSVNPLQKNNYRACFSEEQLVSDQAALQLKGPLLGLISVHLEHPTKDIFLLACDMTSVTESEIRSVLDAGGYVTAYKNGETFEPLCAFYSAAACAAILRKTQTALGAGEHPPGLQRLLHEMNVMALSPLAPANLVSQNTPVTA